MTKRSYQRSLALSEKNRKSVCNFFQLLGGKILNAAPPRNGYDDLVIRKIDAGIEVKSGDNNHPLRIKTTQLEGHREKVGGFPLMFEHYFYCMFCYKNKSGKKVRG